MALPVSYISRAVQLSLAGREQLQITWQKGGEGDWDHISQRDK